MLDMALVLVAFALSTVFALFASLKTVWLLEPLDRENPLPEEDGGPVIFHFVPFYKIKDSSTFRPQVLLALMLFVILALLLKILFNSQTDWNFFLITMWSLVLIVSFLVAGYINTMVILILVGVPGVIAYFLNGTWMTIGLFAGGLLGAYAGIIIARNYRRLVRITRKEIKRDETLLGKPLGRWKKLYKKLYRFALKFIPWVILYKVISFVWKGIDLDTLATTLTTTYLGEYTLLLLSLILSLNFVLFTVPLYREIMESSNLTAAADFTEAVREWEKLPKSQRRPLDYRADPDYILTQHPADNLYDFLDKEGRWLAFQQEQTSPLFFTVIVLMVITVAQTLEKALQFDLIPPMAGAVSLPALAQFFMAFVFITNLMFLIAHLASLPKEAEEDEGEEEEGTEYLDVDQVNIDALWEGIRNRQLQVLCYEIEDDGEPIIEVLGEGHRR